MLLRDLKEEGNWTTTYPMSWKHILKAASALYDHYDQREIYIGSTKTNCPNKTQVLNLRGMSKILHVPISITMHDQTQVVRVAVAMATEEYLHANQNSLNLSLGQYLDSMYR